MVVAGLYDGNVVVYNLQKKTPNWSYSSNPKNGKHNDVVWSIKWVEDNYEGCLNFFSVAGDGRVTNWTIVKSMLKHEDVYNVTFSKKLDNMAEDISSSLPDSCQVIAFQPNDETTFLVGTDSGLVHLCTSLYRGR